MSNNISSSIERLPVELFHRIFDNLDAETILLSIRSVCRLFKSIVNTYQRYNFDFKLISKSNFYLLCRLINPENIISLTLCNNKQMSNQIDLFISLIRLRKFTRLRSLTLFNIDESQLKIILKRINQNNIFSFSLDIEKHDDRRKQTTINILQSTIKQLNLRKLELNIHIDRLLKITSLQNSTITHLTINKDIILNDLYVILENFSHLSTLIIKKYLYGDINKRNSISFRQLTSLTFEQLNVTNDKIELFLLLTPSLIYLKLIGQINAFDGKRWEQFIHINLPNLDKFQFFFQNTQFNKQNYEDLQLISESFRTPFWIEYKKWFITCQCYKNNPNTIYLYSIPFCKSSFQYIIKSEIMLSTTLNTSMNNDPSLMNNVNELILPINKSTADDIQENKSTINNYLFCKVTKLNIDFDNIHPLNSVEFLSSIIDISQLIEVKLESVSFDNNRQQTLIDVITLIQQAHNLTSLIIENSWKYYFYTFIDHICSILPTQIKHLQIPINELNQVISIFERCQYLSTVQFEIKRLKCSNRVIKWFTDNTIQSTCQRHSKFNIIWIGKKRIDTLPIESENKRIKLN